MPTTRPVWDRALSSYILVFDDDWTVRVPGSAGSESPLALIPAEYVGDEFMVRVVEFPGDGNSISVGGMYDAISSSAPCQAGDLGFLPQSFGIRSQNVSLSQVGTKGSRREGPALKAGDSVMVRWVAGSAEVFVNEDWVDPGAPGVLVALKWLLQRPMFSDLRVLCADGSALEAHKALLAAASPVFCCMFQSGMLEAKESSVSIPAPREVVVSLLRHVYTGIFDPNIDASAMIELAHMYDLQDLAVFCGEVLVDNLAPANVSQCAKKLGRLRNSGNTHDSGYDGYAGSAQGQSHDVFEQIWSRMTARIEQDPVLVRALLEGHVHESRD
eukprot:Skav218761  [mRNA]  locus=scaffold1372:157153:159708:- [translate_table: standard]